MGHGLSFCFIVRAYFSYLLKKVRLRPYCSSKQLSMIVSTTRKALPFVKVYIPNSTDYKHPRTIVDMVKIVKALPFLRDVYENKLAHYLEIL